MPSFKANVDATTSSGALLVTVDTGSCDPTNLGCNMASVNVGTGTPSGTFVAPQALTRFPLTTLDDFAAGQTVKISWKADANNMKNLKIKRV
jgi:hypothetical protein